MTFDSVKRHDNSANKNQSNKKSDLESLYTYLEKGESNVSA